MAASCPSFIDISGKHPLFFLFFLRIIHFYLLLYEISIMSCTSIFLETTLIVIFHLRGFNSRACLVHFFFLWIFVFSFVLALSLHFPFKKFIGYFLPFLFIFTKEKTIQLLQLETAEMYRHKSVQAVSPGRFV